MVTQGDAQSGELRCSQFLQLLRNIFTSLWPDFRLESLEAEPGVQLGVYISVSAEAEINIESKCLHLNDDKAGFALE